MDTLAGSEPEKTAPIADGAVATGVGVLDKAMVVLRSVATEPQGLTRLQQTTALPRATAHRLATALEAHGLLRRDINGRFELGYELVDLGQRSAERFPLFEAARPVATRLRNETGEAVQLFVRDGAHRRCVLSLESSHGLRWIVPEGSLLPLEIGSSGRILSGQTTHAGWVQSVGEREAGVASVSAPVCTSEGVVVAALAVSGPVERLTRQPGNRFGPAVVSAAAEIRV